MYDLIQIKRDGGILSDEAIRYIVKGFTEGSIPDYQMSALLMAIYYNGMTDHETFVLTDEMMHSGEIVDLSMFGNNNADKHSTGGVGDKTTLIVAPIVASLGCKVPKMSGRGLGHTGGTLDKLESISGYRTELSKEEFISAVNNCGMAVISQTANITPADKKMYALRDVTATVDSIPLIASSVMSKKLAAGADSIVLDIKCGSGAFMKTYEDAKELGQTMITIGEKLGRKISAIISSMDQPLGTYIGNSLEVIEAIEVLKGNKKGDLLDVSLLLGACMLKNADRVSTLEEGKALLSENITNGKGLEKLRQLIIQQGGNPDVIDNYSLMPQTNCSMKVLSTQKGYVNKMNTEFIGKASVETGAGRYKKTDTLDFGAGLIMKVRLGDEVEEGQEIAEIFSATEAKCKVAADLVLSAVTIEEKKAKLPPLVLDILE